MPTPAPSRFFFNHLRKGNAAYQAGCYADAVREYRVAVSLSSTSVSARSNLGRALVKLGLLEEANTELESALKLSPEHGPTLYYLALCLDRKGLGERAVAAYERFLRSALGATPGYAEKARDRLSELKRSQPEPISGWYVGQVVDGIYQVEELLGEGGFGTVHKVERLGWPMKLAVKSPREDRISDAWAKERFVQEANTWVGLGFHPNIVTCYFVRIIAGLPRIFMEYLEAGTLRKWLVQQKNIDAKKMLDVAIQLARAMERVQYRGLVHRDLKPENCLMTPEGVLKVTDFGLAKVGLEEGLRDEKAASVHESQKTKTDSVSGRYRLGTPVYMAPEQWQQAGKATSAADVWAFGVILFELLYGKKPFQHMAEEPPIAFYFRMKENRWQYELKADTPAELRSIVSSCLLADAGQREPKFSVLRERLEVFYASWYEEPYPRAPIKQTPPLADTLSNQGVSIADLGRIEDALKLFSAALKQDPTHPGATYNQGIILMQKGGLGPDELSSMLEGCKRARPWEWAPEYLRRLVDLQDKDKETAVRELKESLLIWDDPVVKRALAFAEAGRQADTLELFVSLPTGAEAAMAEEMQFNSLLARARLEADAGQTGRAYATLMTAREVKGYERAPLALSLQARLGRGGTRKALKSGWLNRAWEGSEGCLCAAISPDGRQALSGHVDGVARLWELETGRKLRDMKSRGGSVKSVCFLPDMTAALSGGRNGAVRVWDLLSGECVKSLEGHAGAVSALCGLPDGRHVLSAGEDGTLALWAMEDGGLIHTVRAHQTAVRSVRLAKDGVRAVSLGADGLLKQWDILKGRGLGDPIDVGAAHALALPPDDRFALVTGDGWIAQWDLQTRSRTRQAHMKVQGKSFRAVDLSSDGKFLMTGGDDRVARLWDMSIKGTLLQPVWAFEGHKEAISFVTFSPESRWALSAGHDGLRLWDLDWEFVFPEHEGTGGSAPSVRSRVFSAVRKFFRAK